MNITKSTRPGKKQSYLDTDPRKTQKEGGGQRSFFFLFIARSYLQEKSSWISRCSSVHQVLMRAKTASTSCPLRYLNPGIILNPGPGLPWRIHSLSCASGWCQVCPISLCGCALPMLPLPCRSPWQGRQDVAYTLAPLASVSAKFDCSSTGTVRLGCAASLEPEVWAAESKILVVPNTAAMAITATAHLTVLYTYIPPIFPMVNGSHLMTSSTISRPKGTCPGLKPKRP